jgi:acetyltransferase-like isoleucine patch superfamily enzyme
VSLIKKIAKTVFVQLRSRGFLVTVVMNISHAAAIFRALFFRLLYYRNIRASLFSMQANSTIDIFSREARITIGRYVFIRKNSSFRIDFNGHLSIGEKVFINDNCTINCVSKISIGRNTKIAPNVCINDHDHDYKQSSDSHLLTGEVIIGDNVWIGSNVVILRDTEIGDNAVIAAGSVVKGKVPADTLFLNKRENRTINYAKRGAVPFTPLTAKESI